MADIKLFNIKGTVKEYQGGSVTLEKELQTVIEKNMLTFFGVTFLASEYSTTDGGRIDSIGIDENNCPVIFEYKRSVKDNVINQGCFYLDWLKDHKDSFKVLVAEKFGLGKAAEIDWSAPRVVCIAADFTKYDKHAVNQMNQNISLIRYKKFGMDLLMFEKINEVNSNTSESAPQRSRSSSRHSSRTFSDQFANCSEDIKNLYEELHNYILSQGDDITEKRLVKYVAFSKIKNIACIILSQRKIILYLALDVAKVKFEDGFSRNQKNKGHWGTGDVEISIKSSSDLEKAKPLIDRAYNEN